MPLLVEGAVVIELCVVRTRIDLASSVIRFALSRAEPIACKLSCAVSVSDALASSSFTPLVCFTRVAIRSCCRAKTVVSS